MNGRRVNRSLGDLITFLSVTYVRASLFFCFKCENDLNYFFIVTNIILMAEKTFQMKWVRVYKGDGLYTHLIEVNTTFISIELKSKTLVAVETEHSAYACGSICSCNICLWKCKASKTMQHISNAGKMENRAQIACDGVREIGANQTLTWALYSFGCFSWPVPSVFRNVGLHSIE